MGEKETQAGRINRLTSEAELSNFIDDSPGRLRTLSVSGKHSRFHDGDEGDICQTLHDGLDCPALIDYFR